MKLDGAHVVVAGMARSGVAAVELLLEKGAKVTAVDRKPIEDARLASLGIRVEAQEEASFARADLIVLSPGVPADLDEVVQARGRGVQVIGDLELASWFLEGEIIGITGANGKTTTTALTGHILQHSGIPAQVGGNIGTPPCSMVASSREGQWNVLELSSFQLETIEQFRAHIGAALNVTPDHLDRHYTMERYAEAKGRLFVNQRPGDFAVLNADDSLTRGYAGQTLASVLWFSSTRPVEPGAWLEGGCMMLGGEALMDAAEVPMRGIHNLENTMSAALMAGEAGASHEQIREAVMAFPGVEHRLEFVRQLNGVTWYNDSKATNVDATLKALAAFPGGLWVILGGKDKDADYSVLAEPMAAKARGVLLIGATAEKIERQLHGAAPVSQCGTLAQAVELAFARARSGDTVLLAPACASFDQFENFEHRGREFKRLVGELGR
ncbi:MAG TPA: UDP-N-acetylmuramoyl-L-alanine--D-glutamate ligase [Bryobacteraceae bacterium]|nr:UDP-N-acetylmuramoyl-L-alanine--D-glutamate ligase [Bryobacteraceae bacterium]